MPSAIGEIDEDDTDFWLATPGFRESLIEAEADIAAGRTYSAEEVRARFGLSFAGSSLINFRSTRPAVLG